MIRLLKIMYWIRPYMYVCMYVQLYSAVLNLVPRYCRDEYSSSRTTVDPKRQSIMSINKNLLLNRRAIEPDQCAGVCSEIAY